ncbi:protein mono-ADP-ribosyltransferase PARP11-like isoform X2 [Polypterus senegalus]|nr:protein mono-ADP-ribosyltransferase PARP11-like isoform X2 [Polypterus senegalus]XP_039616694.1 protein mono-ADP-ribosyltransferase PARP11-like isoform X2 [Polypterus senegalus]
MDVWNSQVENMDTSDVPWCWFYLAECGVWHMFDNESSYQLMTSNKIEEYYRNNGGGTIILFANQYEYCLNFSEMKLINKTTGRQHPVKRAPYRLTTFRYVCDNVSVPAPSHWENVTDEPYQLIPLHASTNEFKEVSKLFGSTMSESVKEIARIQNIYLWDCFYRKKRQMCNLKRAIDIEEMKLFHGTSLNNLKDICMLNFDPRLHGSNQGTVYGKGTYFARHAIYATKFCKQNTQLHVLSPHGGWYQPRIVFLARVLVGEYTTGREVYKRPPQKESTTRILYDSCVDDIKYPNIYVIFDSSQMYPEYVIAF